ncbi:PadR family transcriptional regulator [Amycolatopsis sp. NPDC057786]|uniref:PadR family transcriptional regulator n=1 Tax=Amycolatopsis sp. NPDC057786 TaxID=3346250 RepID=UPI00366C690B
MSLRHAVLAASLSGEYSGYRLTKAFDVGVANFWYAQPQQLYLELSKLENDGLTSGRERWSSEPVPTSGCSRSPTPASPN